MSHRGHTCVHWNTAITRLCPSVDEDITCRSLQELPDLWVRCRAAEVMMEGPDNQPPHFSPSLPTPAIEADSHQPPLSPPLQSPASPQNSLPHTVLPHTPHSPIPNTPITPHTPVTTPHTPLPHTPLTPHSPLTPLTSQSTLASEASTDSGVASAHSLDLHNSSSSLETHALRRRAGSSVSSGTSEVWLGSLDGDPAGLEVLPELWPHSESPTTPAHGSSPTCPSPLSPRQSPTPSHHSPTISCHSPVAAQQSPTTHNHLLPPDTAHSGPTSPVEGQDSQWHSSPPRANPKEAFSSVIPLHPSALSPHTGPVWSPCEEGGTNRQNCVITVNSVPSEKIVLHSKQPYTKYSASDEAFLDKQKFFVGENQSVIQENYNLHYMLKKFDKSDKKLATSNCDVERMAREGCVWIDKFASLFVKQVLEEALTLSCSLGWSIKCSGQCQREQCREEYQRKESSWWAGGGGKGNRKSSIPLLGLSCGSPGLCWTPELPYSPSHRPHSRSSLGSTLSFSHDSLVSSGPRMDDSHLITGAVSHDALLFPTSKTSHSDVSDIYNVPLDGDIYAVPVDVVKPKEGQILHPKAIVLQPKKRHHRRHAKNSGSTSASVLNDTSSKKVSSSDHVSSSRQLKESSVTRSRQHSGQSVTSGSSELLKVSKRHSVPSNIGCALSMTPKHGSSKENHEPIHMTLEEVRKSFHESDDTINCNKNHRVQQDNKVGHEHSKICRIIPFTALKSCKRKETMENRLDDNRKKGRSLSSNIRNTLITIFGLKKGNKSMGSRVKSGGCVDAATQGFSEIAGNGTTTPVCPPASGTQPNHTPSHAATTNNRNHHNQQNHQNSHRHSNGMNAGLLSCLGNHRSEADDHPVTVVHVAQQNSAPSRSPAIVTNRALPPLPLPSAGEETNAPATQPESGMERREEEGCDFASIIEKVKDCGWYWGPISGEAAEKVLANEPDGSFIVRDSSDHHYIFSLTFKLNGFIRHVRIEHDQGNFSFGGFTKFKSQTIVEFIENAVEHSRSGRYLFFLHRRPVLGPMRVQLLHPVSRFKHIQSLQHLCRFVIVKHVRRDLIGELPLPQRLKDYLCSPHYYSERVEQCMAAAAAAASDNENSASSEVAGEGQSVPSQVLHPSLGELQDSLSNPPTLLPGFPGVPQPVMDRASQTSQAASPNPPQTSQDSPHLETLDTHIISTLQEPAPSYNTTSVLQPTLQDPDFNLSSLPQQPLPEPNHCSKTLPESSDEEDPKSATNLSFTCCSSAPVECATYPQVSPTSPAHTASASPALQGHLAFAHQHTTSAGGPLSLASSMSDGQHDKDLPPDRAPAVNSHGDTGALFADVSVSREFVRINPCRDLDNHVFEDLGGV